MTLFAIMGTLLGTAILCGVLTQKPIDAELLATIEASYK